MLLIIKVSGFARGFNTRPTRQHIGNRVPSQIVWFNTTQSSQKYLMILSERLKRKTILWRTNDAKFPGIRRQSYHPNKTLA